MTMKSDFTPDEWALVSNAPSAAAGGVIEADKGFISEVKEVFAVAKAGHAAREKYKSNALIQDLIPRARMKDDPPPPPEPKSPFIGLTLDQTIDKVKEAVALVQRKASAGEAAEYKAFCLELADVAANASGEGFMGTGQKVSEKEAAYLAKLKAALA